MPLHSTRSHRPGTSEALLSIRPQFAAPEMDDVPRERMPDGEMDAATAYQIVHDELMLDGNARLNLATFVTTWMDDHARRLMAACTDKNMIDKDEYPQTAELERRCVAMLAHLWHAPANADPVGCSTTGSSEACMLAGMALLRRWRARRDAVGMPADRPNLVMGANVQVCWEKFCRYWDVEPRLVPVGADATHLTPAAAVGQCDEQTIGVVAVLGSTFDGSYEPVADIAAALDRLQVERGLDVPVHVDAASGGFVAPFVDPDLVWDFRLRRVQSINASGHKYGLVYPGVGWALWRDRAAVPDELVFHVDHLGGDTPTFALNFSRPGAQVVAQYYMLLRLGFEGYRRVQQAARDTGRVAVGADGRARTVPAPQRRITAPRVRLPGGAGRGRRRRRDARVHGLRRVRAPAQPGLAGAGLPDAAGHRRRVRAPRRGPERVRARPGVAAGRGPSPGGRRPAGAIGRGRPPAGVPPLTAQAGRGGGDVGAASRGPWGGGDWVPTVPAGAGKGGEPGGPSAADLWGEAGISQKASTGFITVSGASRAGSRRARAASMAGARRSSLAFSRAASPLVELGHDLAWRTARATRRCARGGCCRPGSRR